MAIIGTRVFTTDGTRPYLSLSNEEWVRPMGWGNDWVKVRIGVLMAVTSSAANIPTCSFVYGLCSGAANPYADPSTTTHFIGMALGTSAAVSGTWTYNGLANPIYTMGHVPFKRIATTNTLGTGTTPAIGVATTTGTTQRKQLQFMDILRASPNYFFYTCGTPSGSSGQNHTVADLIYGCEQTTFGPTVSGVGMTVAVNGSQIAVDEATYGTLDCINLYWNQSVLPMEIYGIAISRHL